MCNLDMSIFPSKIDPYFSQKPDYTKYQRFDTPFDDFFAEEVFGKKYSRRSSGDDPNGPNTFHKQSITSKAYYNTILPNSQRRPYLILFYSDWCYTCLRIESIWAKLTDDLEPVGFGFATVHTEHEKELTRKTGAKQLPHVILLIEGRVIHYKVSKLYNRDWCKNVVIYFILFLLCDPE